MSISGWTAEHEDSYNCGCDCSYEHAETKKQKRRSRRNIPVRLVGIEVIEDN